MEPIWGFDLGGTKIEGVILKSKDEPNNIIARMRVPTEKTKGYDHIIGQIGLLVNNLKEATGLIPTRIGLGTPGALDPITQTHKNSNTTAINGMPFKRDLEKALGISFEMANDATCFAIAEARMGVVQDVMPDAKMVFGVIMGTGVGGGLVLNGSVWNGRQGIGGEWGHSFLDESGGVCYCGKTGCVETLISGPALERYYKGLTGQDMHLNDIIKKYKDGSDQAATQTVKRLIYFFGKGIANLINILDPDVIVLGGGLANIDLLYTEGIESVKEHVFNPRLDTIIVPPKLGDSAGVFGAAFLVA